MTQETASEAPVGMMPVATAERILVETVQTMRAGFSRVLIDALEESSRKARNDVQGHLEAYETLIATVECTAIAATALVDQASGLSAPERESLMQLLRSFQDLAPRSALQLPAQPVLN